MRAGAARRARRFIAALRISPEMGGAIGGASESGALEWAAVVRRFTRGTSPSPTAFLLGLQYLKTLLQRHRYDRKVSKLVAGFAHL
jgi:hypothetical protein